MRILIVGHGAREHALARRLKQDGHEVVVCIRGNNAGLDHDFANVVAVPSYSGAVIAGLATLWKSDLVVPTDEHALFDGAADSVRKAGVPCLGHSRETSVFLERARGDVIGLLEHEGGACAPEGRMAVSSEEWLGMPTHARAVVKPISSQGVLFAEHGERVPDSDSFPAWVESFTPGTDFSLHYIVTPGGQAFLGLTFDYPFLRAGSFVLTGGMGSVVPGEHDATVVSGPLLQACKNMAERLFRSIVAERGLVLRGFISVQFRKVGRQAIFTELDCKPGNPEIVALLATIDGDLGNHFWRAAMDGVPELALNGLASAAISMAPVGYPQRKGKPHIIPSCYLGLSAIHFGETEQGDGCIKSAQSRALCVSGSGATLMDACSKAASLAAEVSGITGLWYRPDIGRALETGAAERVRRSLRGLKERGGKRIMLRLSPEANTALNSLVDNGGFKNETEAINAAIRHAAEPEPGRRKPTRP